MCIFLCTVIKIPQHMPQTRLLRTLTLTKTEYNPPNHPWLLSPRFAKTMCGLISLLFTTRPKPTKRIANTLMSKKDMFRFIYSYYNSYFLASVLILSMHGLENNENKKTGIYHTFDTIQLILNVSC